MKYFTLLLPSLHPASCLVYLSVFQPTLRTQSHPTKHYSNMPSQARNPSETAPTWTRDVHSEISTLNEEQSVSEATTGATTPSNEGGIQLEELDRYAMHLPRIL